MSQSQKVITTLMWGFLVLLMVGVVVSRQRPARETLFDAPEFSLLDQDAKKFSTQDLKGKVWVAEFIFTHCAGPCPMMLGKMKALQDGVKDSKVHLVTFTVDPERDTPEVLKAKAKELGADESRWHFLTGSNDEIQALAKGMLTVAHKDEKQSIIHSEKLLLFNQDGQCVGRFNSEDPEEWKALNQAIEDLRGNW